MARDMAPAAHASTSDESMASLLLYTHNVARVLKPSQHGELAHAIHETLHYALDGSPQDYLAPVQADQAAGSNGCGGCLESYNAQASTSSAGMRGQGDGSNGDARAGGSHSAGAADDEDDEQLYVQPGFFATRDEERPYISYDWCSGRKQLTLPHPRTVTNPMLSDPCTSSAVSEVDLRREFDVTAKFFFLNDQEALQNGSASNGSAQIGSTLRAEWVDQALQSLATATGLQSVDTMILAFPTLNLDRRDKSGKSTHPSDGQIEQVTRAWRHISPDARIANLGFSDLSKESLAAILSKLCPPKCPEEERRREAKAAETSAAIEETMIKNPDGARNGQCDNESAPLESTDPSDPLGLHNEEPRQDEGNGPVHIPSSPSQASLSARFRSGEAELREAYGPGACRRPRLCTINLREQSCDGDALGSQYTTSSCNGSAACCWDRGLADYCKEEKILLVAHSDQHDILPAETLPTLMNEFAGRLPHSLPAGRQLKPVWCLKYTVLIRDRGVLADKGFILFSQVV